MPRNAAAQAAREERGRIEKTKKEMKKAAALFKTQQKQYRRVNGLDGGQGYDQIVAFLNTYAATIQAYRALQPEQRSRDAAANELMNLYTAYMGDDALEPVVNRPQGDDMLSSEMDENSALTKQDTTAYAGTRAVTQAQKAGLNAIAQWMYRNGKERHQAFINGILRKTDREKLFMYYLIENKKRKNPTEVDFYSAQADDYVPDLDAFKEQMVASKLKLWKRMPFGDEIYWSKLEDAAHASAGFSAQYRAYVGQEPDAFVPPAPAADPVAQAAADQQEQQENGQGNANANAGQQNGNAQNPQNANPEAGFEQVGGAEVHERELAADNLLVVLKNHQKLLAQMESKGTRTEADNAALANSAQGVGDAFRRLIAADKAVKSIYGTLPPEMLETVKKKTSKAKSVKKTTGEFNANLKKYARLPLKEAKNEGKNYFSWELGDSLSSGIEYSSNGLSTLMGVTTLIGLVAELITIKRSWATSMGSTNAINIIGAVNKLISGVNDTGGGALNILAEAGINFIEKGGEVSKDVTTGITKTVGAYASVVTGAIDVGMGITNMVRAGNSQKHMSSSINAYTQRKQQAFQQQGHAEEMSNDDRREVNLQKKLNRDFTAQKVGAGLDMVAGALKVTGGILTLTGAGALAGAIISTAGFVLGWVSTITKWAVKRKNRKKAVDDYIGLDEVMNAVKAALGANWKNQIRQYGIKDEKALREQVRYELLARIDCRNEESAYNYIVWQYAKMLYRKLFFKANGDMITTADIANNDPEYLQVRDEFVPIAKALKIRPVYPANANAKPYPTVDALMAKLA